MLYQVSDFDCQAYQPMFKSLPNISQSDEVSFAILKTKLKPQQRGKEGMWLIFLTSTLNGSAPQFIGDIKTRVLFLSRSFFISFPYIIKVSSGVGSWFWGGSVYCLPRFLEKNIVCSFYFIKLITSSGNRKYFLLFLNFLNLLSTLTEQPLLASRDEGTEIWGGTFLE